MKYWMNKWMNESDWKDKWMNECMKSDWKDKRVNEWNDWMNQ